MVMYNVQEAERRGDWEGWAKTIIGGRWQTAGTAGKVMAETRYGEAGYMAKT